MGDKSVSPARRKKLRILAKIDTHNAPFKMHNKNNKREKSSAAQRYAPPKKRRMKHEQQQ